MKIFYIIFISFILYVQLKHLALLKKNKNFSTDDDGINAALNKLNSMDKKIEEAPIKSSHVDIYDKIDYLDVINNIGNIIKCDPNKQDISFRKLNFIINNVEGAAQKLKDNMILKNTLKIITYEDNNDIDCRVNAAKLLTRLYDIPTSIQTFNTDKERSSKVKDTIVVVPRIQRIYRPDEYIENYKAGNWKV